MSYKCCFLDVAYVRFNYNLFSNILLSFFFYIFVVHDSCLLQYHAVSTGKQLRSFRIMRVSPSSLSSSLFFWNTIFSRNVGKYLPIFNEYEAAFYASYLSVSKLLCFFLLFQFFHYLISLFIAVFSSPSWLPSSYHSFSKRPSSSKLLLFHWRTDACYCQLYTQSWGL